MLSGLLSQGQSLIEVMDEQGFGQSDLLMFFSLLGFNADLEELRLGECPQIGNDEVIKSLAQALCLNRTLQKLSLAGNGISLSGTRHLARGLGQNNVLKTLNLSKNPITDEGFVALVDALYHNTTLQLIAVFDCGVGDASALAMARLLKTHTRSALTNVHMGSNLITDVGAQALAQALETNTVVAKLGMVRCQLTEGCVGAFRKMLQTNVTLNELWLHDNEIPNQVFSDVYYVSTQIPIRRNFQAIVTLVSVCDRAEYLPMEILQIVKDLLIGKPLSVQHQQQQQLGEGEEEEEEDSDEPT